MINDSPVNLEELDENSKPPIRPSTNFPRTLEAIIRAIDVTIAGSNTPPARRSAMPAEIEFAVPPASTEVSGRYIVFSVGNSKYAVSLDQVKEVSEATGITPVPNTPDWVLGVTHMHGDIVSVVDCAAFLDPNGKSSSQNASMCVVRNGNKDLSMSLLVDNVEGMLTLTGQPMMKAQGIMGGPVGPYLAGVYENDGTLLSVLDLEKLLTAMSID